MMKSFTPYLVIILLLFSIPACTRNKDPKPRLSGTESRKVLERINRELVGEDKELIEAYIKRHRLDGMRENGAGLYYLVWGDSTGAKAVQGNLVEFSYRVSLLDGTVCYESRGSDLKVFRVGQGGVESGLEQAVLLMNQGQKGKFILPPHLAYGLLGDNNKIPRRSIIVYDIEMLRVIR
jgi:FKBP-type peptidyl-prolyl cis-trans isomerase